MSALHMLYDVFKTRWARLFLGLFLAELAVCSLFLLMGQTGARLSAAILGTGLSFALLRFSGIARIVLRYFERLATHDATFRALADLRVWFYRRLADGAAAGLGFRRSGDLLSRLVSDVQSLDSLYLRIFVPTITAFISLPILIWVCMKSSMALTLSVTLLFVSVAFILPAIMAVIAYKAGPGIQQAQAQLHNHALDFATGLREMRIFNQEENVRQRLLEEEETLYALQRQQGIRMAMVHAASLFLTRLGIVCALCACIGILYPHPHAVLGITILFVVISAMDGIVDLPRAGLLAGTVRHAAERVADVTTGTTYLTSPSGDKSVPQGYALDINSVSFGWTDDKTILHNVSLHLREGERAALIGPSGAGKSSLSALLLKVATPQKGCITLGGVDIADIETQSLRSRVAWLSQASHLFDDTIRNNLLLGRDELSETVLWEALEQAQIADFVRSLPDGLETWVGENGSRLSGGQGRRIALARVLLSSAPVLILDEPGTGLDLDTEKAFLSTLNTIGEGRTILLVTHRLTGIEQLDHVWQIEEGTIMARPV